MLDVTDGQHAVNVAELEMTSRHHQLTSQLANANEHIQRASVVTIETQIAANKASDVFAREHCFSNVLIIINITSCSCQFVILAHLPS